MGGGKSHADESPQPTEVAGVTEETCHWHAKRRSRRKAAHSTPRSSKACAVARHRGTSGHCPEGQRHQNQPMRFVLLLASIAMPAMSYLSQTGWLGPDNGTISNRYPTLLVAAGYAFAIWGVIFLLDLALGVAALRKPEDDTLRRTTPAVITGFVLTGLWSPVFTLQRFWLALAIIWLALGAMAWSAVQLARAEGPPSKTRSLATVAVSLHAGWLSLAAFLNLAQVLTANEVGGAVGWSMGLYALAAGLLLGLNHRMRGNVAYAVAALWGLAAVFVKQRGHDLEGSDLAAWVAVAVAAVLALQTVALRARHHAS